MQAKYFTAAEFKCKCGKSTCDALTEPDSELVKRLDTLREDCGFALVITSGLRCKEYNQRVGGVSDSAHVEGKAADIASPDSTARFWLLRNGSRLFDRFGVGKTFIHFDVSDKPAIHVSWTYYP